MYEYEILAIIVICFFVIVGIFTMIAVFDVEAAIERLNLKIDDLASDIKKLDRKIDERTKRLKVHYA